MASLRLGQLGLLDVLKAQLYGYVAVGLNGLLLSNDAGACFHYGNRNNLAGLIEDLGHTHFLADDCFLHFGFLLLLGYWLTEALGLLANMTRPPDAFSVRAAVNSYIL